MSRGLERAELGGDVQTLIAGYVNAARLKLTEGELEAASGYLERARPLVEQAPFPDWTGRFERMQTRPVAGAGQAASRGRLGRGMLARRDVLEDESASESRNWHWLAC